MATIILRPGSGDGCGFLPRSSAFLRSLSGGAVNPYRALLPALAERSKPACGCRAHCVQRRVLASSGRHAGKPALLRLCRCSQCPLRSVLAAAGLALRTRSAICGRGACDHCHWSGSGLRSRKLCRHALRCAWRGRSWPRRVPSATADACRELPLVARRWLSRCLPANCASGAAGDAAVRRALRGLAIVRGRADG